MGRTECKKEKKEMNKLICIWNIVISKFLFNTKSCACKECKCGLNNNKK